MSTAVKESLYELQEHLEALLTADTVKPSEARWREALSIVGTHIATAFDITDSEVAILIKTRDGQGLKFAYPPALGAGANIFPLKVYSFAGNVVRTAMGAFDNAFTEKRHLSFYEQVKVEGPKTGPIHKIMAAPLKTESNIFGVVEVSRKAATRAEAGPDFTTSDLALLYDILDRSSPYLESLQPKISERKKSPARR